MNFKILIDTVNAGSESHRPALVIVNDRGQILATYAEDIPTDYFLLRADLLEITETWVDAVAPIDITKLQLVDEYYVPRIKLADETKFILATIYLQQRALTIICDYLTMFWTRYSDVGDYLELECEICLLMVIDF